MFIKSFFFTAAATANGSVIKLFIEIYYDFIEMEKRQCFETLKNFLMYLTNFSLFENCSSLLMQLPLPKIIPVIAISIFPDIEWGCWLVRLNLQRAAKLSKLSKIYVH